MFATVACGIIITIIATAEGQMELNPATTSLEAPPPKDQDADPLPCFVWRIRPTYFQKNFIDHCIVYAAGELCDNTCLLVV